MSRPKKKPNYNPDQVMQEFMAAVADAFGSYDDREDKTFPGLNAVAAEFEITALKARKLLITSGVYSTALSRQITVNNGELVPSARFNCTTLPKQEYRLAGWLYRSAAAPCRR